MAHHRPPSRETEHERGAVLVEFALILPVFMMLILGMFTGGLAYNQKISMTNAAREASRYGATLPVTPDLTTWLRSVATTAIDNATGDLDVAGRRVCASYIHPDGTAAGTANDRTESITVLSGQSPASVTPQAAPCKKADGTTVDDGYPTSRDDERRVVVYVSRPGNIQLLFDEISITLEATSVTRFEAVT